MLEKDPVNRPTLPQIEGNIWFSPVKKTKSVPADEE